MCVYIVITLSSTRLRLQSKKWDCSACLFMLHGLYSFPNMKGSNKYLCCYYCLWKLQNIFPFCFKVLHLKGWGRHHFVIIKWTDIWVHFMPQASSENKMVGILFSTSSTLSEFLSGRFTRWKRKIVMENLDFKFELDFLFSYPQKRTTYNGTLSNEIVTFQYTVKSPQ